MPRPRKAQVSLDATPYYHCMSRCVRRAFLCGTDDSSGKDFSHRRQWIVDKLFHLQDIFAIELCAYAVMANHYHVVLHIHTTQAESWTEREVIERWHRLFQGTTLSRDYLQGIPLSRAQQAILTDLATHWRSRLMDISWFMRVVNEAIARQANQEDHCTGRFWEGRFRSQALLDEKVLMACLAYVDLNPIRARLAKTPEASDYTSIQERMVRHAKRHTPNSRVAKQQLPFNPNRGSPLLPFSDDPPALRRKHPASAFDTSQGVIQTIARGPRNGAPK